MRKNKIGQKQNDEWKDGGRCDLFTFVVDSFTRWSLEYASGITVKDHKFRATKKFFMQISHSKLTSINNRERMTWNTLTIFHLNDNGFAFDRLITKCQHTNSVRRCCCVLHWLATLFLECLLKFQIILQQNYLFERALGSLWLCHTFSPHTHTHTHAWYVTL